MGNYDNKRDSHADVVSTDVWLTPPEMVRSLGSFDLDPCSPINRPWDTAKNHYTILDDGLIMPWFGRVWMNPPYGKMMRFWLEKMALHLDGIALTYARTDTKVFQQHVLPVADSMLFIAGRIKFYNDLGFHTGGWSTAASVLIAYGEHNVQAISDSGIKGKHVLLNRVPVIIVGISPEWKSVVSIALSRLNGAGPLDKIYELVERIAPDKLNKNKHHKAKVRQILAKHFRRINNGYYTLN